MHNGDYPGQAFFGVYRGRKQRVESTYNQLLENVQDFPGAVYEAFMNRAHATQFSKTGKVPEGAVPVKPGMSRTVIGPAGISRPTTTGVPRTMSAPLSSLAPKVELKTKASSMNAAVEKSKPTSLALGKSKAEEKKSAPGASGSGGGGAGANSNANAGSSSSNAKEVHVWTDGSCLGNGKLGATAAYAVYFGPGDRRNEAKRVPGQQTNNNGEIFAVIRALEIVDERVKHMTIYTDSKYAIDCLGWLPGWKKKGGMNSQNKPAAHYSMVKYMDALINRRGSRLELVHVRGHQDNEGNNAADMMARLAASEQDIPPIRDWEHEYARLQKKPLAPVTGSPKITAVDSVQVKTEPDDESDYGYSDTEFPDEADIDGIDSPMSGNPSDHSTNTRDTSLSGEDKPAAGKKRNRQAAAGQMPEVQA
ncbi:ribonuclease HI [Rhizoctonia solani]|uniref:ribonuclease H n=1 Tax=Rhizoctonia solani TaxID=456999 RepID=A0A0K6FWD2_9AGAM|nr:ribonuclease HI [Rhizoctonia solani]